MHAWPAPARDFAIANWSHVLWPYAHAYACTFVCIYPASSDIMYVCSSCMPACMQEGCDRHFQQTYVHMHVINIDIYIYTHILYNIITAQGIYNIILKYIDYTVLTRIRIRIQISRIRIWIWKRIRIRMRTRMRTRIRIRITNQN